MTRAIVGSTEQQCVLYKISSGVQLSFVLNSQFFENGSMPTLIKIFYPLFDTHDSPGSAFIWKSNFNIGFGNEGKI
jgi:hypothetical protein